MRNNSSKVFLFVLIAFVFGFIGSLANNYLSKEQADAPKLKQEQQSNYKLVTTDNVSLKKTANVNNLDFTKASSISRPAVVFIKSKSSKRMVGHDFFFNPFAYDKEFNSTGSGVIVSHDGYIVTNNHVVEGADEIKVILYDDKTEYKAKVIGTADFTDLTLLKIDHKNLQSVKFANSDSLQIGEWVLAVGNPFNLTSTVTAGIVSAKGRNLDLMRNNFPLESFIQTDAAINPGNSGGALVNLDGELIGVNTAIFSKTGSYSGYGFAIPSNIVKKVVEDLIEYGAVQRAFLEVSIANMSHKIAEKFNITYHQGVFVSEVYEDGAAYKAGLKKNDIIIGFDHMLIKNRIQLEEHLAYMRPGDQIQITILRNGKKITKKLTLFNSEGNTKIIKDTGVKSTFLGATISPISKMEKKSYGINYGIKINHIKKGLLKDVGIPNNFIVLSINNKKITNVNEFINLAEKLKGRVYIRGITQDGRLVGMQKFIY